MCSSCRIRKMKTMERTRREEIKRLGREEEKKRDILLGLCTRGWLFCLIKSVEKDAFP